MNALGLLVAWAVLGFVALEFAPQPRRRYEIAVWALMAGPVVWALVVTIATCALAGALGEFRAARR